MIGDFGHSKAVHNHSKSLTLGRKVGTIGYIAPELINESDFEKQTMELRCKIDVWSFGCVLYEVICLKKLFDLKSEETRIEAKFREKIESFNIENIEKTLEEIKKTGAAVKLIFVLVLKK